VFSSPIINLNYHVFMSGANCIIRKEIKANELITLERLGRGWRPVFILIKTEKLRHFPTQVTFEGFGHVAPRPNSHLGQTRIALLHLISVELSELQLGSRHTDQLKTTQSAFLVT
jgi:hypothetical protein